MEKLIMAKEALVSIIANLETQREAARYASALVADLTENEQAEELRNLVIQIGILCDTATQIDEKLNEGIMSNPEWETFNDYFDSLDSE